MKIEIFIKIIDSLNYYKFFIFKFKKLYLKPNKFPTIALYYFERFLMN